MIGKKILLGLMIPIISLSVHAQVSDNGNLERHIYTPHTLDSLLITPSCLKGYRPNQAGFLNKIDEQGNESIDTTFTIEEIKILSDSLKINGWLYLPLGNAKHPLVILTNGGGSITKKIRSFSDWLAPSLAHCGIAAFVHDKRGTGESEGRFIETTYDDYITDAGNCAVYLSKHERINSKIVGVAGASEGGRIAVLTASRYSEISFVISFAGTVVSAIDDRINAQKGWLQSLNLPDSTYLEAFTLHEKSIRAWASNKPEDHERVNNEIKEKRLRYNRDILPCTKQEMDSIPDFADVLPTWYSLSNDYLSELEKFNKKWLAIFGEIDRVVPTKASVDNILHYMSISGNDNYNIAIIPDCGHAPINIKTKRMIRLDNIVINWMNQNLLNYSK